MKRKKQTDGNGFDEWGGYMNAKINKLEEQFDENATNCFKKSNLFSGVSIFVNGLTDPSSDELKRIMMSHGVIYHTYQKSNTSFVVASNLPDVKIRQITNTSTSKIIRPQWIVDCLKEERILDYSNYLLYTNCTSNQRKMTDFQSDTTINSKDIIRDVHKTVTNEMLADERLTDDILPSAPVDMLKELNFLNERIKDLDYTEIEDSNCRSAETSREKSDLKLSTRTAVDSNFLSEFYNNSRLHHISTMGAKFKEYISELRENHNGQFPGRDELLALKSNESKEFEGKATIMHIDMDCFFVSVGLRSRPQLRGFPVAVTHSKGGNSANTNTDKSLSEIASCSYEARKMGLKNGMFVGKALQLCPALKTIPYDFDQYKEVALSLYDTIAKYTLDIEAVSCDEMYVDLKDVLLATRLNAMDFVSFVRDEIKRKTGCPCSSGVGANRLQARMATKKAKPDGQFELVENHVDDYFLNIEISELPGVGYNITKKLSHLEWKTCADLREITLSRLQQEFGAKFGMTLHQFCRGIDTKPLVFGHVRKSVSTEVNYGIRFTKQSELKTFLTQLCTEVHRRLTEIKRRGKSITLKYMVRAEEAPVETAKFMGHGICDHVTTTITLNDFTDILDLILRTVMTIQTQLNVPPAELRGIGVQISKLDSANDTVKGKNSIKCLFGKVAEKKLQKKEVESAVAPKMKESDSDYNKISERVLRPSNNNLKKVLDALPKTRERGRSRGRGRGKGRTAASRVTTRGRNGNMFGKSEDRSADSDFENSYEELDMDVLAELPQEIQEEILREHKAKTKKTKKVEPTSRKKKAEDGIDAEFLAALPPDIRKEVLQQQRANSKASEHYAKTSPFAEKHPPPSEIKAVVRPVEVSLPKTLSENNVLGKKNWRSTITAWLNSTTEPLNEDIEIFADYACELIDLHMLNELYLIFRCLFRLTSEFTSCHWHSAYFRIIRTLQKSMLCKYKTRLQVETKFRCDCVRDKLI